MITIIILILIFSAQYVNAETMRIERTDGINVYANLYTLETTDQPSIDTEFIIEGDISDKFAINLNGLYLSYAIYEDGKGNETVYYYMDEYPTYWRYDQSYHLIYSDDYWIEADGEYIYYISLTYNIFHGYYMDIKRATYLPINASKFYIEKYEAYLTDVISVINNTNNTKDSKYDINGILIKDFSKYTGWYIINNKIIYKHE